MNDLFRFLLLRPASVVPEDDVNLITPNFCRRRRNPEGGSRRGCYIRG